ncbi:hypothetical protein AC1031_018402 [Aphanomyces cochlioides]|nr:hypothetical protein AC1031_018402 [Aphanomyces cochlioides]
MNFPRVEFTQEVYEKHLAHMERLSNLALNGRSGWDKATATPAHGWISMTHKMGWEILSLEKHLAAGVHEYLCLGSMNTTIEALQDAFYVHNTYEFRALCAVLYDDAIVDAAVLNVTHQRTQDDMGQFFGVKYMKLMVHVMNDEDQEQEYIYLEFAGTRRDALGRKTFFVISDPVAVKPGKHSLSSGQRCSCVKLYREAPDGSVEVTVRTKLEPGIYSKEPASTPRTVLKNKQHLVFWKSMGVFIPSGLSKDVLCINREVYAPEARRLTTGPFSHSWQHGSKCSVCMKAFGLLRRKHHCRRCGSTVCATCTMSLYCVDRPTKLRTSQPLAAEKFCKSCLAHARLEAMRATRQPPDSIAGDAGMDWEVAHLLSPSRNIKGEYFFMNERFSSPHSSIRVISPRQQPISYPSELSSFSGRNVAAYSGNSDDSEPERVGGRHEKNGSGVRLVHRNHVQQNSAQQNQGQQNPVDILEQHLRMFRFRSDEEQLSSRRQPQQRY